MLELGLLGLRLPLRQSRALEVAKEVGEEGYLIPGLSPSDVASEDVDGTSDGLSEDEGVDTGGDGEELRAASGGGVGDVGVLLLA